MTAGPMLYRPPTFTCGRDHSRNDSVIRPAATSSRNSLLNCTPRTLAQLGVTAFDAVDGGPVPIAFAAATLNVYVVPLVSPVTICVVAADANTRAGCASLPM